MNNVKMVPVPSVPKQATVKSAVAFAVQRLLDVALVLALIFVLRLNIVVLVEQSVVQGNNVAVALVSLS